MVALLIVTGTGAAKLAETKTSNVQMAGSAFFISILSRTYNRRANL
jgi:hypothetical protein